MMTLLQIKYVIAIAEAGFDEDALPAGVEYFVRYALA